MSSFQVQIPASAANLGPGFDSMALALNLHNELAVEIIEQGLEIEVEGEGEARLPSDASNMIARAAYRLFRTVGASAPGMRIRAKNRIPLGSGLGSSSAAIVGGLLVADSIAESGLSHQQLLEIAWEMEGHADNAAAAMYGGLIIVGQSSNRLIARQIPVAPMPVAVVTPGIDLPTRKMRRAIPRNVTLHDAALNLGRMGLMVEALRLGDFELMAQASKDRLHEPYRMPLIPGCAEARAAGIEAGAAAVTLAGAGPSLIAFAPDHLEDIAEAMAMTFADHGLDVRSFVLEPEPQGALLHHSAG